MPPAEKQTALLPGFGVLFNKEFLEARRSKRIIIFLVIMTGALVLVPVIGYLRLDTLGDGARHDVSQENMRSIIGSWAALVGYLGSLMVIASTVDAMTRERSTGISAWILTKPVSRPSYLLAKATAHTAINALTLIVMPTIVFFVITIALFQGVPTLSIVLASLILGVEVFFLSFLTIALGVPFRSVTPVSLITLAIWFLPNFVPAIVSLEWTYRVLPSYLPLAAIGAVYEDSEAYVFTIPLASIGVIIAITTLVLLQFERQEL